MTHVRLLDADFLVNYIRTLSLIQVYEPTIGAKITHFCTHCPYNLVTTKHVETEVNNKIGYKIPSEHDDFFKSKKQEAQKIKREIFEKIRVIDIRNNNLMDTLQSTWPRNPGEQSLVVLLSSKYADSIQSSTKTVKIVSNNSKDIYPPLRMIKQFNARLSKMNEREMVMSNYDFYHELFTQLNFEAPFKKYYYFVSNIDARLYDKNKLSRMISSR
jgi:hypothetical protein